MSQALTSQRSTMRRLACRGVGDVVMTACSREERLISMSIALILSLLVSIAIPFFAVYLIFALDLFGTGKRGTVFICLAWGAVGAFLIAYVVNNRILYQFVNYETITGLMGPLVEEIAKALILIYFIQRPSFRYIVDGAVYGFAVGTGFAVAENLLVYMPIIAASNAALADALSRVLSTALMHAAASALVGIGLGRLRRSESWRGRGWPVLGIGLAIVAHIAFNNIVAALTAARAGPLLLLVGIGMGAAGFVLIAVQINQGLSVEKQRFARTLGLNVGVSASERRAVQQLGGDAIEDILKELAAFFGEDKIGKIRQLLVIQANIGILQNNLAAPASDRLRKAWQEEIAALRLEVNTLRKTLGLYVMSFLRGVFPEEDAEWSESFGKEVRKSDPTQVHSFDIFMRASEAAGALSPQQIEQIASRLQRAEIFRAVSLADLENLSRAVTETSFQAGDSIFEEGDEGDTLYLIRQGQVNLYVRERDGDERLLGSVRSGDVVGELALLDGQPRSAAARAEEQVVALRLRREHFLMFMQSRPAVIQAVLRFLADRVRRTTTALETSIAWATSIAQGKYEDVRTEAILGVAMPVTPSADGAGADHEPATAPAAEPAIAAIGLLGGAFSKIASALESREQQQPAAARAAAAPRPDPAEIAALPAAQREVVELLLRDPIASSRGMSLDRLRRRLEEEAEYTADLPTVLEALDRAGWLEIEGTGPRARYSVRQRRSGSRPSLFSFGGADKAGRERDRNGQEQSTPDTRDTEGA